MLQEVVERYKPQRYLHAVVNKIDYNDPGWIKSMNAELEKFRSKDVYEEVPIPTGVKPISMGWVHTEKIDLSKVLFGNHVVLSMATDKRKNWIMTLLVLVHLL